MIVGRIKDDPTCRVIVHDKSSLAPEGPSIAFRLDKDNGFEWEGIIDITVDELLSGEQKTSKLNKAKDFLKSYLADGPKAYNDIEVEAAENGIKSRSLYTAKDELGVVSKKVGAKWFWGF